MTLAARGAALRPEALHRRRAGRGGGVEGRAAGGAERGSAGDLGVA